MGFRTVVIINNDRLDEIQDPVLKDLVLGWWGSREQQDYRSGAYRIVEQTHCDHDTLMHVRHLDAKPIGYSYWDAPNAELDMLRQAADKLGYKLIRKSNKE